MIPLSALATKSGFALFLLHSVARQVILSCKLKKSVPLNQTISHVFISSSLYLLSLFSERMKRREVSSLD